MAALIVLISILAPGLLSILGWFFVRLIKSIDDRFTQIDNRFEQVDRRFEQVDKRFEKQDEKLELLRKDIEKLSADHARLEGKLEILIAVMQQQPVPQTASAG